MTISATAANLTFTAKESTSTVTEIYECSSQNTGVKTRKVAFLGNSSKLLWLGYGEGRCLSHWAETRGSYDPYAETSRLSLTSDPYDLCVLSHNRCAFSSTSGDVTFVEVDDGHLSQVKVLPHIHGLGDSRVLAVSNNVLYSGSSNGTVASVDVESGNVNKFNTGFSGARSLSSFSGGSLLATGHSSGQLLIWDTRESSKKPCVMTPSKTQMDAITALSTHPAQANIITFGTENGAVGFCDVRGTAKDILPLTYNIATAAITQVLFHPQRSDHLVCSSADGSIVHWDATTVNTHSVLGASATSRGSPWLSEKLVSAIRLNVLRPVSFSAINAIDISGGTVVAASDIMSIFAFQDVQFGLSA